MTPADPFTFEQLTDRDLAILDRYVWGKDAPPVATTAQVRATIAEDTKGLRRRIEAELERRRQAPRKYRATKGFKSITGTELGRLSRKS